MITKKECLKIVFCVFFTIVLISTFIILMIPIFDVYLDSDRVECDYFGNCYFIKEYKSVTIETNCFENGEKINCSDFYDNEKRN